MEGRDSEGDLAPKNPYVGLVWLHHTSNKLVTTGAGRIAPADPWTMDSRYKEPPYYFKKSTFR